MTDLDPAAGGALTDRPTGAPAESQDPAVPASSPYEATIDAAPAAPVHGSEPDLRRRPVRWPVAIVLIAAVLAVSAFVGILVTGRAPDAKVLAYVPGGTIAYGEARLDLPGDQRLALASFLSKFPGFADQAAIESKLNEVMDRFVGGVTKGDQTYTTNIQPWFDGELAFALPALPDPSTLSGGASAGVGQDRALFLVSIKDPAAATAWVRDLSTTGGATPSDTSYGGATLTTLSGTGSTDVLGYAAIDGKVLAFGDVASVKAAIDTQGKGPFAAQASPKAALEATDSSHLGFMYLDLAALLDWTSKVSQSVGSSVTPGFDLSSSALRAMIPDWEGVVLRVEGDAVLLEAATDRPTTIVGPADNRASSLTDHVPVGALAFGVGHDLGATLINTLNVYKTEPSMKSATDAIDQVTGLLGGVDGAVGWFGDAGYVINLSDGAIEAGLLVAPTDRAAADKVFTSLRTILAIGGSQAGITVRDEVYAGATITTIDLGDLGGLLSKAGVQPGQLGPGMNLTGGRVELAYAVTDQVVVIGSGPTFVKHILDTTPATSIASTDRFKSLVGRIGNGTGLAFVDIAAIRGLVESAMAGAAPSAVASYEQEVKPFLVPFDALIEASSVKGDIANNKVIITVK